MDEPAEFTVSASACTVAAGAVYELPVPLQRGGSFLVYRWEEKSALPVRFTVQTDEGRTLVDEVQATSSGSLCVTQGSRLSLRWDNSGAWLNALSVGYSVQVLPDCAVQSTLRHRLLHAARHGLLGAAQECLDHGVPIDGTNEAGYTPLMLAVLGRHVATAELLLRRGASIAAHDRRGNRPLHLASLQRAPGVVRLLLDAGAERHARNHDGMTAAHIAAFTGGAEVVQLLITGPEGVFARDAHANTPLHLAASAGHTEVLPALLEHGLKRAGPNARGDTPLGCAVSGGHSGAVTALLQAGALGPAAAGDGTALLDEDGGAAARHDAPGIASIAGAEAEADDASSAEPRAATEELARCVARAAAAPHAEVLLVLLATAGEALGEACVSGLRAAPSTCLPPLVVAACWAGARLPVLRLLQAGASPDSEAGGCSALRAAAERGDAALVALLVRRGAMDGDGAAAAADDGPPSAVGGGAGGEVEAGGEEGGSAMQAAVRGGHTAVVGALLDARRDGSEGRQALLLAAAAGRTGLLLCLLERGVPLDGHDSQGRSALHRAAAAGHTMTALALLRKGCSAAASDGSGTSAVHAAILAGHRTTALALLRDASLDDAAGLLRVGCSPRKRCGVATFGDSGGEVAN